MVDANSIGFELLFSQLGGDLSGIKKHKQGLIEQAIVTAGSNPKLMVNLIPDDIWTWKAYDEQVGVPRYSEKCKWFLRRLAACCFSEQARMRMIESKNNGVPLKFKILPGNPENTPKECMALSGSDCDLEHEFFHVKAPCNKLHCACTIVPSIDFTKPITPGGYISSVRPTL